MAVQLLETFDHCSAEDLNSRWNADPAWRLTLGPDGGHLAGEGRGWARLRAGADWTDYSFRFRLLWECGIFHASVRVGHEGRYYVGFHEDGMYLKRERPTGTFVDLDVRTAHLEPGVWHDVEILVEHGAVLVYVDRLLELEHVDAEPLPRGSVAFETLPGTRVAVDDVRIDPITVAVQFERVLRERFESATLAGWWFEGGARVVPRGDGLPGLRISGPGEAIWRQAVVEHFTLTLRLLPERLSFIVAIRRSGEYPQLDEYRLRFDRRRCELVRVEGEEQRSLATTEFHLECDEWYDVAIHTLGEWILVTVDGCLVVSAFDPAPLPPGVLALANEEGAEVVVADLALASWATVHVEAIAEGGSELASAVPPHAAEPPSLEPMKQIVPLTVTSLDGTRRGTINPGPVPPSYVHAWALDLASLDTFRLHFDSGADVSLDFASGDRLTVLDSEGNPLAVLASLTEVQNTVITAPGTACDQGQTHRRVYLQLETSVKEAKRRLSLGHLHNEKTSTGAEQARLLANDIDLTGPYCAATIDAYGKTLRLAAPWKPFPLKGPTWPFPTGSDGWFLVGRYLSDTASQSGNSGGFFTLTYYNERKSLLRLYLYNHGMPDASLYSVTLRLCGRASAGGAEFTDQYVPLEGAFFPVDPDPGKWSSVTVPIPMWSPGTWAFVEVPLLYPMAKTLPGFQARPVPGKPASHYHSVYEDTLKKGMRNALLKIEIESYLEGAIGADLIGTAAGSAIQTLNAGGGADALNITSGVWNAINTGKDWYDKAEQYHSKAADYLGDLKKKGGSALGDPSMIVLSGLVSLGATAWCGPLAVAGAAFSMLTTWLAGSKTQALQLSIELGLRGELTVLYRSSTSRDPAGVFSRAVVPSPRPSPTGSRPMIAPWSTASCPATIALWACSASPTTPGRSPCLWSAWTGPEGPGRRVLCCRPSRIPARRRPFSPTGRQHTRGCRYRPPSR